MFLEHASQKELNDWEVEDMGRLLEILEECSLGDKEALDERLWLPDEEKDFFVKSFFQALTTGDADSFPMRFIWNKLILAKISLFIWQLWWNHILTPDNHIWRGFITPNRWCMCGGENESANHLLACWKVAAAIWNFLFVLFRVQWASLASMRDLLCCWPFQALVEANRLSVMIWRLILSAICRTIWVEHKQRTFNGISTPFPNLVDSVLGKIHEWLSADPFLIPALLALGSLIGILLYLTISVEGLFLYSFAKAL